MEPYDDLLQEIKRPEVVAALAADMKFRIIPCPNTDGPELQRIDKTHKTGETKAISVWDWALGKERDIYRTMLSFASV
jgi:hypothetical protein